MKTVERGAALLDKRLPGWRQVVDPSSLSLKSRCNCVLGQVFGDYHRGVRALGVDRPVDYGFIRPPGGKWERLTAAWRKVLT